MLPANTSKISTENFQIWRTSFRGICKYIQIRKFQEDLSTLDIHIDMVRAIYSFHDDPVFLVYGFSSKFVPPSCYNVEEF